MTQEAVQEAPPPAPGPIATLLGQIMPGVRFDITATPIDETVTVQRDEFVRVMETLLRDERLAFDYLRCQSGVDYLTELESVYHLYSFKNKHSFCVKVRCPSVDTHVPTVSHLWTAANWHERETHEMFGIVYDGHPDLRPLLTEEGLGYYPLLKSHPLADIEEWQEDILQAVDDAKKAAVPAGAPPVVDERAMKIQIAQQKAAVITRTRSEARAKGLSPEDEKAAVQAALARFEEQLASQPAAGGAGAAVPAMSKIELAQAKAKVITKARADARAQGVSTEDEKKFVAEKLKEFSAQMESGGAAAPAAAPKPAMSKIELAQAKAKVITKARAEARAQGMSTEDEKKYVAEKLKAFSAENQ